MFCEKCGKTVAPGERFCNNCGAPVVTPAVATGSGYGGGSPSGGNAGHNLFLALKIMSIALLISIFALPFSEGFGQSATFGEAFFESLEYIEYIFEEFVLMAFLVIPICAALFAIFAFVENKVGCIVSSGAGLVLFMILLSKADGGFGNITEYLGIGFWLMLGLFIAGVIVSCCVKSNSFSKSEIGAMTSPMPYSSSTDMSAPTYTPPAYTPPTPAPEAPVYTPPAPEPTAPSAPAGGNGLRPPEDL